MHRIVSDAKMFINVKARQNFKEISIPHFVNSGTKLSFSIKAKPLLKREEQSKL